MNEITNEELFSKCMVDGTEMQIDKINQISYGHVYLVCPKCGWAMSIRHSMCPDIDTKLRPTERYLREIMSN